MKRLILKHLGAALLAVVMAATVSPMLKARQTIQDIFAREGLHFDFRIKSKAEPKPMAEFTMGKVIIVEQP